MIIIIALGGNGIRQRQKPTSIVDYIAPAKILQLIR